MLRLKFIMKIILKYWILQCGVYVFLIPLTVFAGVRNTRHNLSVSGPGPAQATSETEVCIFCHTPHNAMPVQPLWNHLLSAVVSYTHYTSPTLHSYHSEADAPPIDGYSKLCLSCHDGTVAIGELFSRWEDVLMSGPCVDAAGKLVSGTGCTGLIGTDLSGGHPISIIFNDSLANERNSDQNVMNCKLKLPSTFLPDDRRLLFPTHGIRERNGVQCTSCHDPHGGVEGAEFPFARKPTYNSMCAACHTDCTQNEQNWPW